MFPCAVCKSKDGEIAFLREQVKSLTEKLMVMTNPEAFNSLRYNESGTGASDYYGDGNDEMIEYDAMGQRYIVKRKGS